MGEWNRQRGPGGDHGQEEEERRDASIGVFINRGILAYGPELTMQRGG